MMQRTDSGTRLVMISAVAGVAISWFFIARTPLGGTGAANVLAPGPLPPADAALAGTPRVVVYSDSMAYCVIVPARTAGAPYAVSCVPR